MVGTYQSHSSAKLPSLLSRGTDTDETLDQSNQTDCQSLQAHFWVQALIYEPAIYDKRRALSRLFTMRRAALKPRFLDEAARLLLLICNWVRLKNPKSFWTQSVQGAVATWSCNASHELTADQVATAPCTDCVQARRPT